MLMSIFKKSEVLVNHIFNIFDVKAHKLKLTLIFISIIFIQSIITSAPANYIESIKVGYALHSVDNIFDYTLPLLCSLIICYVFFEDYKEGTLEVFTFLGHSNFNYNMLYRWLFYVGLFVIASFAAGLLYYRNIAFIDFTTILLSLRFIPNILFLSSLALVLIVFFKNGYTGIFGTLTYFVCDFFSSARVFHVFSLGTNSNNYYYTLSPQYYLANRVLLVILSIIFLLIACKRSAKL